MSLGVGVGVGVVVEVGVAVGVAVGVDVVVGVGVTVAVGVGAGVAAATAKDCLPEFVSPSSSVTVSLTYLVLATWKVFWMMQPAMGASQRMEPSWFSKLQLQRMGASPLERVPSSVTAVPTRAAAGAAQIASAGVEGVEVGMGVDV